jgi:Domain of unknown function (DUF4436)
MRMPAVSLRATAIRMAVRATATTAVALVAAAAISVVPAEAAAPSFDGVVVDAHLIAVNTSTASATVRIDPSPSGSYSQGVTNLLTRDVVLYTTTVSGSLGHSYQAGNFMDPFETTVPLEGDTSTYPFHHLKVEIAALAAPAGGLRSGKSVPVQLNVSSNVAGYRVSRQPARREGALVDIVLHVDPSWASVTFAVFMMVVMWALAFGAIAVAVNLIARRRRFEGAFTAFLAALLFAFPTVRNSLPGIPPVGVLFDYAAFLWAEAIVALALVALLTGWTVRALVGTGERRD